MKQIKNHISFIKSVLVCTLFLCSVNTLFAQEVTTSIDTTQIKIGEQIKYRIEVKADNGAQVVFPEGQTFLPLEMVEAYAIDTTKLSSENNYKLSRIYALTQFDSGSYTIPQQKILIKDHNFLTDSLRVEVANVVVDTVNQDIFPIKPTIEIKKPTVFPMWILWLLLVIVGVAGLVFLFLMLRKKKLEREQNVPPYEKAIDTLKKLDESQTLERGQIKEYYSVLTLAIKRYIDEKVDERALESTTEELIVRLNELKENKGFDLDNKVITDLQEILKRADLVKFAGGGMDKLTARSDRKLVEEDINSIKDTIPEPTEEELLKDEAYREAKKKKEKRTKIIAIVVGVFTIITIANFALFENKGLIYLKDLIIYNSADELLEQDWVASEYGNPPVYIITPEVLTRDATSAKPSTESFTYGKIDGEIYVNVLTKNTQQTSKEEAPKENVGEKEADELAARGAKNILVKTDEFTTADGSTGAKVYGSFVIENEVTKQKEKKSYVHLYFASEQGSKIEILVSAEDGDEGFEEITNRIINSIEFNREN